MSAAAPLSPEELARYERQLMPGALSCEAQARLRRATALVTRTGGMGGPAAQCLVMAGFGKVILAHCGALETADLNRQCLGTEAGLGQPRAAQFAESLRRLSRFVEIEAIDHEPDDAEALQLARRVDVILSCPPNFAERLLLNRAAIAAGVPLVDAAQWGLMGSLLAIRPGQSACLRCLYPTDPAFETLFPVVGAISSATGSLAALEAIKIVAQIGQPLFGRLLTWDGLRGRSDLVSLARNPACSVCGQPSSANGQPQLAAGSQPLAVDQAAGG